jgi:hypothetical protein
MATSVKQILVGQPSKNKIKILKQKPVVQLIVPAEPSKAAPSKAESAAPKPNRSIWLNGTRFPRIQPMQIIWEHVEDISDDENDTPQAAGKRLSQMKATREQMRRRAYETHLDALQRAGLFLSWSPAKPLQTHSNYCYEVRNTVAYPINN